MGCLSVWKGGPFFYGEIMRKKKKKARKIFTGMYKAAVNAERIESGYGTDPTIDWLEDAIAQSRVKSVTDRLSTDLPTVGLGQPPSTKWFRAG